jgi:hypothetical protein
MYAPLSCERAGHVYNSARTARKPVLSLRNSAVLFSALLCCCSASQIPCSCGVAEPVTRVVRRRCRAAAVRCLPLPGWLCCSYPRAGAGRVEQRVRVGRSGRGCGGEVRRACGHRIGEAEGLLDCWWLWMLRRGLSREGFCLCCVARYRRRRRWWLGMGRAGFSQGLRSSAMRCELGGSWR